jgi:hypothetical protein
MFRTRLALPAREHPLTKREDGKETRKRLLKTACDVLAEKS